MSDTLSFNVKFRRTRANLEIFEGFKAYAQYNSDDNYIIAIKHLMDMKDMLELVRENGIRERKEGTVKE